MELSRLKNVSMQCVNRKLSLYRKHNYLLTDVCRQPKTDILQYFKSNQFFSVSVERVKFLKYFFIMEI